MDRILPSHIPDYELFVAQVESVAVSGFALLLNYTIHGPEFSQITYPKAWLDEYEIRRYYFTDPVFLFGVANDKNRRWSEIRLPDIRRIMKRARSHGLSFGAVFSGSNRANKSMLSVARNDRELTDQEMGTIGALFDRLSRKVASSGTFTEAELSVVECAARGLSVSRTAELLEISDDAVKQRLMSARKRLGCDSNAQLVAQAVRKKWVATI